MVAVTQVFLTEYDLYTDEELGADPFYYELLWPAGLGWAAATAIPLPTGDTLYLNLERDHDRGPVESAIVQQLDVLRPHLVRSALMSARLQLERARAASETLALIGLPALVFDSPPIHRVVRPSAAGVDSGARCNGSMRTGFARLCQAL